MTSPTMLAGFADPIWKDGFIYWWQVPLLLVVVALVIFLVMYKRRQM